ncbi:fumarylacetoacetate hydrolase family protein [Azoarcus sp. L1K30]|uniref:fumarylacetoacetate hydrolase family protein n=1 Tax=Azoarcus sp. L1K30 TaxID=2820277 RepID=UPI001B82D693|nr:fumarylacetoacetate hydrolase family protein [Azoarcus sp. L1K30]MBR0567891.1 fumarylacetoacetate hydrolase family protein [Azoarcus sp. L1K30]
MKLMTFISSGAQHIGLVEDGHVVDLNAFDASLPGSIRSALEAGVDLVALAAKARQSDAERLPLESLELATLIPEPGKIVCLGLNYFDHAKESGREKPDYPWLFFRGKSSLMGHGQPGIVPKVSDRFDYEAELAVVIGRTVPRHVSQADALQYVFGYTCFNDMSVRDYQKRTPQWTIGKNFDATGALGPVLVTADELPEGAKSLRIQARLNGAVMQDADTSDMIWSVAETIALLSDCMTLEPGDVIAMGTPAGVGQSRTPPVWMKAGDVIEIEIERIGLLVNPIHAEVA